MPLAQFIQDAAAQAVFPHPFSGNMDDRISLAPAIPGRVAGKGFTAFGASDLLRHY